MRIFYHVPGCVGIMNRGSLNGDSLFQEDSLVRLQSLCTLAFSEKFAIKSLEIRCWAIAELRAKYCREYPDFSAEDSNSIPSLEAVLPVSACYLEYIPSPLLI